MPTVVTDRTTSGIRHVDDARLAPELRALYSIKPHGSMAVLRPPLAIALLGIDGIIKIRRAYCDTLERLVPFAVREHQYPEDLEVDRDFWVPVLPIKYGATPYQMMQSVERLLLRPKVMDYDYGRHLKVLDSPPVA